MRTIISASILLQAWILALTPISATAHEWYPVECCHGRDCAAVTAIEALPDGSLRIATQIGFGIVPPNFSVRPSLDNKAHACLQQNGPDEEHLGWVVICLFMPGHV